MSELTRIDDNLWIADGAVPRMQIPRRMVVARRRDGRLVIHSAVTLPEEGLRAIESLGEPGFLLVPGRFHRRDAARYLARFPGMKVFAPRGAMAAARKVVRVDGSYEDYPDDPDVSVIPELAGTNAAEGALLVRSGGRVSIAVCDAIMNLPHLRGFEGFLMRYVTDSTGGPRVTGLFRWTTVKDRGALRDHLRALADTPGLARVLPAHGATIDGDAAATLRRVAEGA